MTRQKTYVFCEHEPETAKLLQAKYPILTTFLDLSGISLIVVDKSGIVVFLYGKDLFSALGFIPDSSIDMPLEVIFSSDPEHVLLYKRALSGQTSHVTYVANSYYYDVKISPMMDEKGKISGAIGYGINVTDRHREIQIWQDSHEQLANLMDNSKDGIVIVDCNFMIQRVNAKIERSYVEKLPLEGKVCYEHIYGLDAPCPHCPVIKTIETESIEVGTYFDEACGRHFQLTATPLFDQSTGNMVGVIKSFHDVTHIREYEQTIKSQELFVEDILSSIQDGISVIDRNYRILRANDAMERLFPEAYTLRGKICYESLGLQSICENCPVQKTFETGEVATRTVHQEPMRDRPGRWLEHFTHPVFSAQKGVIAAICHIRDITKRKEDEETLRKHLEMQVDARTRELYNIEANRSTLLMNTNTPVFFCDRDSRFSFSNAAFQTMTGYSESELLGQPIESICNPEFFDLDDCRRKRQMTFAGQILSYRGDVSLRHRDGRMIWGRFIASGVWDAEGEITQIAAAIVDITDQKKLIAELEASKATILEASNDNKRIIEKIGSDIITPVSEMLESMQLRSASGLDDKQIECLKKLQASGNEILNRLKESTGWNNFVK